MKKNEGNIQRDLGERLKILRLRNHMTQAKLGSRLGVSGAAVSSYETLKCIPDYYVLKAYLDVFEVDAFWLMTGRVRRRTASALNGDSSRKPGTIGNSCEIRKEPERKKNTSEVS